MKKILIVFLIGVGILSANASTKAMGTYRQQNGYDYIVYYTPNDGNYCRSINDLKKSVVNIGFSKYPWSTKDAETILDVWFAAGSKNTIALTVFDANGQPYARSVYAAVGLPPK